MADEQKPTKEDVKKQLLDLAGTELTQIVSDIVTERMDKAVETFKTKTVPEALMLAQGRGQSQPIEKGLNFGRGMRVAALAKGECGKAIEIATKLYGRDDQFTKTLVSNIETSGGSFVPVQYGDDVIELLRPLAVVRALGPRSVPLNNGNMTIPAITGGATATYEGEGQAAFVSTMTTGKLRFISKKLRVFVPMTEESVRYSDPRIDMMVRDDSLQAIATRSDLAFIRGLGDEYSPRGLRYLAHADNVLPANGTVNLANVTIDLGRAILALMEANVAMVRPGWLMAPRTYMYLMTVRDGNGNYAFKDEMVKGTLMMFPYRVSNQIPKNLGEGANESEVYLADFSDVVIAEDGVLEVTQSNEAAYVDSEGNTISAFQSDLILLKAIVRHDFNIRHNKSVAVLTAVKWGV